MIAGKKCFLIYFEDKIDNWVLIVGMIIFGIDLVLGITMNPLAEILTVITAMVFVEVWVFYFFKFWGGMGGIRIA